MEEEFDIPERPEDLRVLALRARVIAFVVSEPQRSRALAAAAELEARADELERTAVRDTDVPFSQGRRS